MRVIADTNTVVSGLLWRGAPRDVLDAARDGQIQLFTSVILLDELEEVLQRPKFAQRLALVNLTPRTLLVGYAALCNLIQPASIAPTILADPDDDHVLACASAAKAKVIVSGDSDLLTLERYENIQILTAAELLLQLQTEKQ